MPLHEIEHPALRVIADLTKNCIVRICLSNGDEAIERLHGHDPPP